MITFAKIGYGVERRGADHIGVEIDGRLTNDGPDPLPLGPVIIRVGHTQDGVASEQVAAAVLDEGSDLTLPAGQALRITARAAFLRPDGVPPEHLAFKDDVTLELPDHGFTVPVGM